MVGPRAAAMSGWDKVRDTVIVETRARQATSFMRTGPALAGDTLRGTDHLPHRCQA
jgi:hypothetical protein